ncbi:MAG: pilus assembly protein [Sphingomonadales bacterium]|nr:pilus assembly protein [Sphingomonadales bacterium]MDE2168217.1 pilus assembly protein [Sphingomonadales bacterium]
MTRRRGVLPLRLKQLASNEDANTALEFAFVAPAFIALILGTLHIALIYFAQAGLQSAVESAARLITTGQAQTSVVTSGGNTHTGMSASDFKNAVCNGLTVKNVNGATVTYPSSLPPFLSCSRLTVNVQVVPSGCTSPTITSPTYNYTTTNGTTTLTSTSAGYGTVTCSGSWSNSSAGLSGTQGDLVIVQLGYLWPTITAPMGLTFINQPNGNRLLIATYVITVENYLCSDGTSSSC